MECPYMVSFNHLMHGLGIFKLLSSSLEWYEVMLIIFYFIDILPKGCMYFIIYVDDIVIIGIERRKLSTYNNILLNSYKQRS